MSPTVDLAALPSLPLTERRALPETAAIYFVLAGDTVLRRFVMERLEQVRQERGQQ